MFALAIRAKMKRKRKRGIQPHIHHASIPDLLRSPLSTHQRTLLSCDTSSTYTKKIDFDRYAVFSILLPKFEAMRATVTFGIPYRNGMKNRGHSPELETIDILGLFFRIVRSFGRQYESCGMFGVGPTTVFLSLDFDIKVLLKKLKDKNVPEFSVNWPFVEDMDASYNLLRLNCENGRLLSNLFEEVNRDRILCAYNTNIKLHNAYYKGYTGNVDVTNVFLFNISGKVIHAGVNYRGSRHDSKVVVASDLLND